MIAIWQRPARPGAANYDQLASRPRCRAAERCSVTTSVVIGGSSGIGRHIAERMVARGDEVIISSRDATRAKAVATEVGAARGLALDLSAPKTIADGLADVGPVAHLVITAIEQGVNRYKAIITRDCERREHDGLRNSDLGGGHLNRAAGLCFAPVGSVPPKPSPAADLWLPPWEFEYR